MRMKVGRRVHLLMGKFECTKLYIAFFLVCCDQGPSSLVVMFCQGFQYNLWGPAWAVGSYRISPHRPIVISKMSSSKPCDSLDKHSVYLKYLWYPFPKLSRTVVCLCLDCYLALRILLSPLSMCRPQLRVCQIAITIIAERGCRASLHRFWSQEARGDITAGWEEFDHWTRPCSVVAGFIQTLDKEKLITFSDLY